MAPAYVPLLIERAKLAGCLDNHPIALSDDELGEIVARAMPAA
jgi:hypothetical protein